MLFQRTKGNKEYVCTKQLPVADGIHALNISIPFETFTSEVPTVNADDTSPTNEMVSDGEYIVEIVELYYLI